MNDRTSINSIYLNLWAQLVSGKFFYTYLKKFTTENNVFIVSILYCLE